MNVDPLLSSSNALTDIVLSEETDTVKYKGSPCYLSLSSTRVTIEGKKSNKPKLIDLIDVIGATPSKKGKLAGKQLELHCFGVKNGSCCCSSNSRELTVETITFDDETHCTSWCNAINCTLQGVPVSRDETDLVRPPTAKRYLVFVNPVGGTGSAVKIWERYTEPFLRNAGIEYNLIVTERANHAKDIMASCDLYGIHTVVIVGGDGLIFEVVSGLMQREDKHEVMRKLNIAPIPGGSGNGLIKSMLFECGEEYSPRNAAYLAVKGSPSALDLSHVNTLHNKHVSFLILGWGLISDVDILSEPYRWMGETRFEVYAAYRLALKKLYRGRLSIYLQKDQQQYQQQQQGATSQLEIPSLPAIDQPLDTASDPQWTVIEDDFVLVWILQTTHCSASMYSGPGARTDDGVFTIIVVRNTGRWRLLSFLLAIETGDHMKDPNLEVYKATAYRLEPLTDEGLYTLDGEVVEYGPIQGVMQPGALKVLKTPNRG